MKKYNTLLDKSIKFEKLAQTNPFDDPSDPYDDPMASKEAKAEVGRINKLISQIRSNINLFLDAVSLSDEDEVYGDASDRAKAEANKRKIVQLISKLSNVGRQWISDINRFGVGFKASSDYVSLMESLIGQIKSMPAQRGNMHLRLLEPLESALRDFNPSMIYKSPSGAGRAKTPESHEEKPLPSGLHDVSKGLAEDLYGESNEPSFEANWEIK